MSVGQDETRPLLGPRNAGVYNSSESNSQSFGGSFANPSPFALDNQREHGNGKQGINGTAGPPFNQPKSPRPEKLWAKKNTETETQKASRMRKGKPKRLFSWTPENKRNAPACKHRNYEEHMEVSLETIWIPQKAKNNEKITWKSAPNHPQREWIARLP